MHTTDYTDTFIEVADDCPVTEAELPPERAGGPTVAGIQAALLLAEPYGMTSDDLLFTVHAQRSGLGDDELRAAREQFFSKGQACLRSSPLSKRYGWGTHHDSAGRVALIPLGSEEYERLRTDPSLTHVKAMRSSRR